MKWVGRILLIVVGVILLVFAIPSIKTAVDAMNALGWDDIGSYPEKMGYLGTIIAQGVNCAFGVIALACAFVGKRSFALAFAAIIMMIVPVYTLVVGIQNETIRTWQSILLYVEEFALPIVYFIGMLLV